ncbi:MAG: hypothetical protein LBC38_02995 [Oscillospiraceae bacterium]|jgi:hypothetical protein|nr:hypothetical protein [Oscillospiraceae bacterium]
MVDNRREVARKIARFREIITSRVNSECEEIESGIAKQREAELAEFAEATENAQNLWLAEQKQKLVVNCSKAVSDKSLELRGEFNEARERLRESLFAEVRQRLADFRDTPKYSEWLEKKLERYVGWGISYPSGGGFIAVEDGKRADESFERLLSEQTEWFLSVSGLERE